MMADINFHDEGWLDVNHSMFEMVNPNEICPPIKHDQHQLPTISTHMQSNICCWQYQEPSPQNQTYITQAKVDANFSQSISDGNLHMKANDVPGNVLQITIGNPSSDAPPVLVPHEDISHKIQQKLRLQKALSQRRRNRLKAELDSQPTRITLIKQETNKKLTGRERQIELERQEANLLRRRDHNRQLIKELEQKCDRLREILQNIVATSPEYNEQMLRYLESSELLSNDNQTQLDEYHYEYTSGGTDQ